VHAEDLEPCLDPYVSGFTAHQPFTVECRLRRADGNYRGLLDHGVPISTPEGGFAGYIGSCMDIAAVGAWPLGPANGVAHLARCCRALCRAMDAAAGQERGAAGVWPCAIPPSS
jgi:hypothetical protein